MSLLTFAPPVGPSPGNSYTPQLKILEADFGDGYSQPTPDGLNHIKRKVTLQWDALTYEQMSEIVSFFRRHGGTMPFWYRPWGEHHEVRWTCRDWNYRTEAGIWNMTATFVQALTAEN